MGTEDDWLNVEPSTTTKDVDGDDWLPIEDATKGVVTPAFQNLVNACMRGTNRVMACDGHYWAYRPFNREFDKEVNPRTRERFADFVASGCQKFIGTYDEVQIWELLEGSPFLHKNKGYVVGQSYWGDIRQAAKLACDRNWPEYHDLLGVMATAMKSGRDPAFARTMWNDTLGQITVAIKQIGGKAAPAESEVNRGFLEVRKARGIAKGGLIATLNSDSLQKVGFR